MPEKKNAIKTFIASCAATFKTFNYKCELPKSQATIWNFVAKSQSGDKIYAVFCAPKLESSKSLIKLAVKKVSDMRLVVVTIEHTEEQLEASRSEGYALITLEALNQFGDDMIDIRSKELNSDPLASTREKLF
jgi:hypothetical protein